MSYRVTQTSVDAITGVTEHQIRLVPVETIQDSGSSDDDDVEEEEETSSDEEIMEREVEAVKIIQEFVSDPSSKTEPNQVNCMFCYRPVPKFDPKKRYSKKHLSNTCHRLFKFVCNHLDIEPLPVQNRVPKHPGQILPAYLPLCIPCRESYYGKLYDSFVTFEAAMTKLTDQVAGCVTRAIAISARHNKQSIEGGRGQGVNPNPVEDIFDEYERSESEHEVMKAVRQFRQKVVDKNPAGYLEEPKPGTRKPGSRKVRPIVSHVPYVQVTPEGTSELKVAVPTSPEDTGGDDDATAQTVGSTLKNVIKVVKQRNRNDILNRKRTMEKVCNQSDLVKQEVDEESGGLDSQPSSSDNSAHDLNYYAVSNPAPGVIQIIPFVAGDNYEATRTRNVNLKAARAKKRRSGREDYQKQRIALNTCKFCNEYFPGPGLLIAHQVRKHGMERPEKCSHPGCDYRAIDKGALKSHMSTHLQGDEKEKAKKYTCHICGFKFAGKGGLDNHLRTHSGEKPFVCELCGKAFSGKASRQLCLDKHNGVKNHKCAYCDKTFLRKEVLVIHERTHTGEKPFKCEICGKAFAQRTPLIVHLRMHKKKNSVIPDPD